LYIFLSDNGQVPALPTWMFSMLLKGEFRSYSQLLHTSQQLSEYIKNLTIPYQGI
jgi:hypothetical protein